AADVPRKELQHLGVQVEVVLLVVEAVHLAGLDDHALGRVSSPDQRAIHQFGLLGRGAAVASAGGEVHGNANFAGTAGGGVLRPFAAVCTQRPAQVAQAGFAFGNVTPFEHH